MVKNSRSLRVGFCYDDSLDRPDGVSQYVKTLGTWLSVQGHDVAYLVGETKINLWAGSQVYSLSKNLKVRFNGNRVGTPLFASKKKIDEVLAKHDFDILHVQMPYSPLFAGRVIKLVGSKTAVVGTFHILPANPLTRLGCKLLRLFYLSSLKRFSRIVSVSQPAADFARQSMGINSAVLPNAVELDRFSQARTKPQPNHIVFLGRLVKRKGCEELIRAYAYLKSGGSDATLTIAGDGPERIKLEAIVEKSGLEQSVKFIGSINEKDKPDILAKASIACFPSLGGESFGIVLIEAMAAGAGVVIGGNNPGYGSVLGERPETLFDPREKIKFAAQLKKFLTDTKLVQDIHNWQQEHVQQYDTEVVGPKILEVYVQAIAKRQQTIDN